MDRTRRRVDGRHAALFFERPLHGLNNMEKRDLRRRPCKPIPSTGPALALNELSHAKFLEDLFEVTPGNPLPFTDHANLYRLALSVVGQVKYPANGVVNL